MYHFVDLSREQRLDRRHLLDFYGLVAQFSVLVPVAGVILAYLASKCLLYLNNNKSTPESPSSPRIKAARRFWDFSSIQSRWRRVLWWSTTPVYVWGFLLGKRGEILGAIAWTGWLLALSVLDTGEDYLHLTKRLGTIGASQLPFHYLLSLKSPWSPLLLLTGSSEATLLSIHKALGRIITGFFWLHAILYLNFYIFKSLLLEKLQEPYILCGVFGILAFSIVTTTSLSVLRTWSYRVFYYTHVSLASILLPVLYFHVEHIRPFIYETAAIYAINVLLRYFASTTYMGTMQRVEGRGSSSSNLVEISIPLGKGGGGGGAAGAAMKWQPGQHAYISLAGHPFLRTFRSNPFTQASLPLVDNRLRFIARIMDGNTAKLARSIRDDALSFSVEGPYGIGTHSATLLRYDRVLFVAGGVGATFVVPLYRQLLADLSPSKGSYRRQKVRFVWVARSLADVTWALPVESKERDGFVERLSVHVSRQTADITTTSTTTTGTSSTTAPTSQAPHGGAFVIDSDADDGPEEEGIELDEQKELLQGQGNSANTSTEFSCNMEVSSGRPNVVRVVDQVFSHGGTESVAIVACGPRSLSHQLRKSVSPWAQKGRDVWFWDESFAI